MYECSHDTYTWYFRLSAFRQPLWIWNAPGIGFSPLGQLGVPVEGAVAAVPRQTAGARLGTVHWGGAGGSGYMLTLGAKLGEASTVVGMDEVFFFKIYCFGSHICKASACHLHVRGLCCG